MPELSLLVVGGFFLLGVLAVDLTVDLEVNARKYVYGKGRVNMRFNTSRCYYKGELRTL